MRFLFLLFLAGAPASAALFGAPAETIGPGIVRESWAKALTMPQRLHAMVVAAIARIDFSPVTAGSSGARSVARNPSRDVRRVGVSIAPKPPVVASSRVGRLEVSLDPGSPVSIELPSTADFDARARLSLDAAWKAGLRAKLEGTFRERRSAASRAVVTFDAEGRITRIRLIETFGTRALGSAAVRLFNSAGPYPRPPRKILDADGATFVRWNIAY